MRINRESTDADGNILTAGNYAFSGSGARKHRFGRPEPSRRAIPNPRAPTIPSLLEEANRAPSLAGQALHYHRIRVATSRPVRVAASGSRAHGAAKTARGSSCVAAAGLGRQPEPDEAKPSTLSTVSRSDRR